MAFLVIAALLGAAVLAPGVCSVAVAQEAGVPGSDPVAQESNNGHSRGSYGMDGGLQRPNQRLVHYRADEGFVPARLNLETGTRVVLVDETGGRLEPRFGPGRQAAAEPGDPGDRAEHPDQPPPRAAPCPNPATALALATTGGTAATITAAAPPGLRPVRETTGWPGSPTRSGRAATGGSTMPQRPTTRRWLWR